MKSIFKKRIINLDFYKIFKPELTPKRMMELGVFGGSYFGLNIKEFPKSWFKNAKISAEKFDVNMNYFNIKSGLSIDHWISKGWIFPEDPIGWFQWYCRYWMGRRIPILDAIQIARWKAFVRHSGQIKANCKPGDLDCRPRQRQGIFQWAHNPFI